MFQRYNYGPLRERTTNQVSVLSSLAGTINVSIDRGKQKIFGKSISNRITRVHVSTMKD